MRHLAVLLLAPALALAQPDGEAPATAPLDAGPVASVAAAPAIPPQAPSAPASSARPLPRWGLQLDAGVPDGAVAAAVFRPVPPLRFSLGAAYNYVGYGMRAGVAWTPVRWAVSPTLNFELGRYRDADLTFLAGTDGVPQEFEPLLESVGFWYGSAQLGFEMGSPRGLSFNVRVGLSYVTATAHGTAESTDPGSGATVSVQDPRIKATLPSLKVGFLYWF
jgi:hypothetical protein